MVGEITKESPAEVHDLERSPLLPERHPTADLFVCDIFDAAPKGDMASMEHPIFSLSTKPDTRMRRYENGDHFVEVRPSVDGLATVHDRDVLIYCISQIMAALNEGTKVSQTVQLHAYDVLKATNRTTDGRGYEGLKAALRRLQGTQIVTNVVTGGEEQYDIFSLIDRAKIIRATRDGRMQEVEIKLSDWVFNAIRAKEVLTLHRDYFRLRKPLERRMYELARKHCGRQREWKISLELLQKKCGSNSTLKEFRRLVGTIIKQDRLHAHFPEYALSTVDDAVMFANRQHATASKQMSLQLADSVHIRLQYDTHEKAKRVAPGYDVYALESEWRDWLMDSDKPAPKNPDAAFIGFCKARHKRAPLK